MSQAELVLIATETGLRDRSITVEQLRLLGKNGNRFLELCKVWDAHQKDTNIRRKAQSSLKARLAEIRKYQQEKRLDDIFVGVCVNCCATVGDSWGLNEDSLSKEVR